MNVTRPREGREPMPTPRQHARSNHNLRQQDLSDHSPRQHAFSLMAFAFWSLTLDAHARAYTHTRRKRSGLGEESRGAGRSRYERQETAGWEAGQGLQWEEETFSERRQSGGSKRCRVGEGNAGWKNMLATGRGVKVQDSMTGLSSANTPLPRANTPSQIVA